MLLHRHSEGRKGKHKPMTTLSENFLCENIPSHVSNNKSRICREKREVDKIKKNSKTW